MTTGKIRLTAPKSILLETVLEKEVDVNWTWEEVLRDHVNPGTVSIFQQPLFWKYFNPLLFFRYSCSGLKNHIESKVETCSVTT